MGGKIDRACDSVRAVINRRLLCAMAMTASVTAAGCGGSGGKASTASHVDFKTGFAASQQDFRRLGTDIAKDITGANAKSDAQLGKEFSALSTRAGQQATQLAALRPPARYKSRMTSLVSGFHSLRGDLSKISTAATDHDASTAETATRSMLADAAKIKTADTALSKALGLPATRGASGTSKSSNTSKSSSASSTSSGGG
jgi:hypothetical protein